MVGELERCWVLWLPRLWVLPCWFRARKCVVELKGVERVEGVEG